MREAKGEYSELEGAIAVIDSKRDDLDTRCSLIRLQWNLLLHDLVIVAKALGLDPPPANGLPRIDRDLHETENELIDAKNAARLIAAQVLEAIQTWMKENETVHRECGKSHDHQEKQKLLTAWISKEIEDLRLTYKSSHGLVDELMRQNKSITGHLERAIHDTKLAEEQLEQTHKLLDESAEKLAQAEKRSDRLDSKAVTAFPAPNQDVRSPLHRDSSVGIAQATANQTKETSSPSPEFTEKQMAKEYRMIVDARNRELQELRREKEQLIDDLERLRGKFISLTDEQLMATEYFKTLQLSLDHYKARAHYLEDIKLQLEEELDDVRAERRKLADEVKTEKGAQEAAIEGEMKRLENDLQRIRKQHDDYQQIADTQISKKTREAELYEATVIDVEKQAQRIADLEKRLSELRVSIQDSTNTYAEMAQLYDKIHTQISDARIVLDLLESNNLKDLAKDPQLQIDLERKFAFWEQVGNTREEIRSLMNRVDERFFEYKKIELMISFFVNNESQLMTQIDRAGAIFTKLEEQSSKPVFNHSQKNEQKTKLQAEKSKYAHTFGSLKTAKEKQSANVATLRRTSEQQLEHIRQLEDREKSIEQQVCEKENEVRKTVRAVEEHRNTVEDLQHQCSEIRISSEHNDNYFHELQKILKDKTKALDEEKQLRRRVDEDYEKMQRKWNALSQGDSAATEQLFQECEELRASRNAWIRRGK
ncbi:hypothetical protein BX666DRAFT_1998135 [Dichotomocladium elegans]|nr:hypothetical protein BX666DRAFT_1998135 [Dichotomocladium elegans]